MTTTFQQNMTMVVEHCCDCGIAFAMTSDYRSRRLNDHKVFYCPAGHPQHFTGETDADRARKLQKQLEWGKNRETALRDQLGASERSNAALRGVNTRTKNRIAKGICPCCRRNFADLAKHMSGQHPNYSEERS